jgi:hypothetical protein
MKILFSAAIYCLKAAVGQSTFYFSRERQKCFVFKNLKWRGFMEQNWNFIYKCVTSYGKVEISYINVDNF